MNDLFVRFRNEFIKDTNKLVDSTTKYYDLIINDIPNALRTIVGSEYLIKSSVGQGRKTLYPWIGIFDKRITTKATKGLYVVILFQSNMQGFYLTIDQGITNYDNRFGKLKYEYARKVSNFFKESYENNGFSTKDIDLISKKNDLGHGYEQANIISKYYSFDKIEKWSLHEDIIDILSIYNAMVSRIIPNSYETFVDLVLEDEFDELIKEEDADILMTQALLEGEQKKELRKVTLELVEPKKHNQRSVTVKSKKIVKKIDYANKAMEDSKTGFLGEKLVKDFEKERLRTIGLEDYINKIKWVSLESDSFGYDLESYDLIDGRIVKRYIEVKTSRMINDGPFYVSDNELNTSKRLGDNYWVYRVYDATSESPKIYCLNGAIDSNFVLKASSYIAS